MLRLPPYQYHRPTELDEALALKARHGEEAIFVSGGINTTLPKQMWDDIQLAVTPTLAAVATSLVFLMVFFIPRFQQLFDGFGAKLPWLTRVIVGAREAMRQVRRIVGPGEASWR